MIAETAYSRLDVFACRPTMSPPGTSSFVSYPDEMPRFWEMTWKVGSANAETRMLTFIVKRVGLALLVAIAVSALAFLLLRASGDVAIAIAGEGARAEDIDNIRRHLRSRSAVAGAISRLAR